MHPATESIIRLIRLSRELLSCADEGDLVREDDRCGVLFGLARDCAYRIIADAEEELVRHGGELPGA